VDQTHSVVSRINMAYGGVEFEVQFYTKLRNKVNYAAPEAVWAKVDTTSYNSFIMLYDLGGKVTFCTKNTYASKEMVENQMRTLAKLHGAFYESKDPDYTQKPIIVWGEGFQDYCEMCKCVRSSLFLVMADA
jgi:hypothetical protein